jgi:hypothetical protein
MEGKSSRLSEAGERQLLGLLSVHEFLLEVLYANVFAQMPAAQAGELYREFRRAGKEATIATTGGAAIEGDRFWEKVRRREGTIRAEQMAAVLEGKEQF